MPEFVFNPRMGETSQEAFSLKGNPSLNRDWWQTKYQSNGEKYSYSVAHWALTEARFRKHLKGIKEDQLEGKLHLDEILVRVTQDDVINRKVFDPMHRSFVPDFQVYIKVQVGDQFRYHVVSRQMVLFAVERRKAWRMLQSKAGVINKDYQAQKALLKKVDEGIISNEEFLTHSGELFRGELETLK
jgi:pyruvate-ferredoxin/flavodoxin oxidoreductase